MAVSLNQEDRQWIIDALEQNLERVKGELREDLSERLESMETRLLTAFQKWASPVEIRQRGQTASVQALELDMIDVKERLEKLEGKKPQ